MKLLIVFFFFLMITSKILSQGTETIEISFAPTFLSNQLKINQYYKTNQEDSIQITSFKFYVSNIELVNEDKIVWRVNQGFYLIDLETENSQKINCLVPKNIQFDKISFDLGIDSLTNVSGALGGALDPTQGMYWTWQSGYINLKLEGNFIQSMNAKNDFVFHLGGYQSPFNTIQNISFQTKKQSTYQIGIELNNLISEVDLQEAKSIMSPKKEAIEMAVKATKMFVLK
jgi:hypothetical protein